MTPLLEPAMSARRRWLVCLLIGLPIGVLFGPALITNSSFALRDAGHFYYPLFQWTCEEWAAGRIPLWNHLDGGGTPVVADASSSVFYPGKLLFALPIPFALRYKLYIIAHVALAAIGAYRLAKHCGASMHAAGLAAIAYSCGGSVAFQYSNVIFLVGAAWLPWAFQAWLRELEQKSWRSASGLGVVLALMILGGDPQMAVHALLAGVLYLVVTALMANKGSTQTVQPKLVIASFGALGISLVVALLLAAVQVLPSREAATDSVRSLYRSPRNIFEVAETTLRAAPMTESAMPTRRESIFVGILGRPTEHSHHEDAYDFSLGPWRFAELFWPNVFGRMFPTHRRWINELPAEGRIWTPTIYLGLLTSVLGLWQLRLRSSDMQQTWLSWTFVVFALGALGWYGLGWFVREIYASVLGADSSQLGIGQPVGGVYWFFVTFVPGYVQFRYPAKLFVVASLALSILAAKGWDRAMESHCRWLLRGLKLLATASAICVLLSFFAAEWFIGRHWKADPALGPFDGVGALHDLRFAFLQSFFVSAVSLWMLRMANMSHSLRWHTALLLLMAVELSIANRWFVATAPSTDWERESLAAGVLDPAKSNRTALAYRPRVTNWWPDDFATTASSNRIQQIHAWEHNTLFPKHNLLADVALVDSSSSLRPIDRDSFWRVARQLGDSHGVIPHKPALQLVGSEFLIAPTNVVLAQERWKLIPTEQRMLPEVEIWQLADALPEAWVVYEVKALKPQATHSGQGATDKRTREVLLAPDGPRDFRQSAVVEADLPGAVLKEFATPGGSGVKFARTSPQKIRITAELSRPGLLVINQAFNRGWVARRLDNEGGETLPILRTNRIQQGVLLPAGNHTIELSYEPTSFRVGAAISAVAWLGLFVVWATGRLRRR